MTALMHTLRHPVTRRLGEAILTLIGVSILTFIILRVVPGDQITAAYGTEAGALSPEQIAQLRAYYGIDEPLVVQYFTWLGGVLTGNLGINTTSHQTVAAMTAQALPNTFELAIISIIIGLAIGIPGGMYAANRPGGIADNLTQAGSLLALSIPTFLLATVLGSWVADVWGWYPNGAGYATLFEDPLLNLQQMLLPSLVLGISIASPVLQTTRTAILEIRSEDYIRTARAKGVPARRLQVRHVLRNALIPVVTMTGLQFGFLLGGALLVEQIFAIPGIGRQTLLGLNQKEYAVVQSTVLIIATMFVLVNLLTDLLYRVVDPKVRVQ
ncbi:ABC transporter permease [Microbacterium esteraromaticum]|uniref:ABC transporter permease n=1 Tax=Microbacterium esteraromaticum TaxID=57043 RepID=A0A7D8ALK5_9MICO|nr:ABC transporter permease [Microbacterium esteraromaticum]QMU97188.1 ABC transporter permease [Microbacterium esteraromaticum]